MIQDRRPVPILSHPQGRHAPSQPPPVLPGTQGQDVRLLFVCVGEGVLQRLRRDCVGEPSRVALQGMASIHAALVRVYCSTSHYGDNPFQTPATWPRVVNLGNTALEFYFGDAPQWLLEAEFRGYACVEGRFGMPLEPPVEAPAKLKHWGVLAPRAWMVCVVLHTTEESDSEELQGGASNWLTAQKFQVIEHRLRERRGTLDLAESVLRFFCPNVLDEVVVRDRIVIARDAAFSDAQSAPSLTCSCNGGVRSPLEKLEHAIADPSFDVAFCNVLRTTPLGRDDARQERLERAAREDRLADDAGRFGRYELERDLQRHLMRATDAHPIAVMFVDMNGLKQINDTMGHDAGDAAIVGFHDAVRETHRGDLYRLGGDEFALFQSSATRGRVAELARNILVTVASRQIHGLPLSASIGIAFESDPLQPPKAVVKRADDAMYRAKKMSKRTTPRSSTLAIGDDAAQVVHSPGWTTRLAAFHARCRLLVARLRHIAR
jgi:diguanylate cyclase (GGDEF)-like protein